MIPIYAGVAALGGCLFSSVPVGLLCAPVGTLVGGGLYDRDNASIAAIAISAGGGLASLVVGGALSFGLIALASQEGPQSTMFDPLMMSGFGVGALTPIATLATVMAAYNLLAPVLKAPLATTNEEVELEPDPL